MKVITPPNGGYVQTNRLGMNKQSGDKQIGWEQKDREVKRSETVGEQRALKF